MSETVKKPMVNKSFIGNNYFYFTRHKRVSDKAMEIVGQKTDVSDSVGPLVDQEILAFLDYVKKTHNLDLRDPEPKEEEGGQKYIYGVKEVTGYTYLNDLVAEWRNS